MLMMRLVRSCRPHISYIPENQQITLHFKTAIFRLMEDALKAVQCFS